MHSKQLLLLACVIAFPAQGAESSCYGKTSNGYLVNSVKLPEEGRNFQAYSSLGVTLGRTYLHSRVRNITLSAYQALAKGLPQTRYVYGETGWKEGGSFRPHRTHQNGLSVDFFVPVKDATGRSVPLPTSPFNKFGYAIEFDAKGRVDDLTIDFAALGEHLYQLDLAAKQAKTPLALVILERSYLPRLFATEHGAYLQQHIPFMQGKPWVRHDDHYHVDFAVQCNPIAK